MYVAFYGLKVREWIFLAPYQGGASFVDCFVFLVMLHVCVCYAVVSVPCSLVVTCWERADLLAVVFVEFCHFPKCVLVHIRIKGEVGAVKLV